VTRNPPDGRHPLADFAPALVGYTEQVLFADVWNRPGLSARDRSLITVTALVTGGHTDQLPFHLRRARDNGLTTQDLVETITHLAFYAGWPKAMSAMTVAKTVLADTSETDKEN
jgi:4-carboxymuconolactone decarboxylase